MRWILAAAILTGFLQQALPPRLETAPAIRTLTEDFQQGGLAIFDVNVNEQGQVANHRLLHGRPPLIEPTRVTFGRWEFRGGSRNNIPLNVTFLYKPKLDFPDSASVVDVPLPDSNQQLTSPFPVVVVEPGFPMEGLSGGTVVMQVGVRADGRVQDVRVINDATGLTGAAVGAVRDWKFHVPKGVYVQSQPAVVAIYFQTPRRAIAGSPGASMPPKAALVAGTSTTAPIGRDGVLDAGGPNGLTFAYPAGNWTLPYPLIQAIEYVESPSQNQLNIRFTGARSDETVSFRLDKDQALSIASVLSARAGRAIEFKLS